MSGLSAGQPLLAKSEWVVMFTSYMTRDEVGEAVRTAERNGQLLTEMSPSSCLFILEVSDSTVTAALIEAVALSYSRSSSEPAKIISVTRKSNMLPYAWHQSVGEEDC